MLSTSDAIWQTLEGGYRVPYDASVPLRRLEEGQDVWEELWQEDHGPAHKFYQGLIQVAVCLHHFGNGNTRGAKKLYLTSTNYLKDYGAFHEGIDLKKLVGELTRCCQPILDSTEDFPRVEIDPELIPEIHLDPSA